MKFIGVFSAVCVLALALAVFFPDVEASKLTKLKIAKKVAKFVLLRGARNKVILALPLPLPVPFPVIRKTVSLSNANPWYSNSATSIQLPSITVPEPLATFLRPALNSLPSTLRSNLNLATLAHLPVLQSSSEHVLQSSADGGWPSVSTSVEAWPVAHVSQQAWPSVSSAQPVQQEVIEQQQQTHY